MSVAEMSSRREERAAVQYDRYAFRATTIAGHPVVYVTAPAKPGVAHPIYTVNVSAGRCNCPDFQKRCADTGVAARCKHAAMAERFLKEHAPKPAPAPAPKAAPKTETDAEKIARRERSNRDVALWL